MSPQRPKTKMLKLEVRTFLSVCITCGYSQKITVFWAWIRYIKYVYTIDLIVGQHSTLAKPFIFLYHHNQAIKLQPFSRCLRNRFFFLFFPSSQIDTLNFFIFSYFYHSKIFFFYFFLLFGLFFRAKRMFVLEWTNSIWKMVMQKDPRIHLAAEIHAKECYYLLAGH